MTQRKHIKRSNSRKPAYFSTLLGIISILLFSITFSFKQVVFNPDKMNESFNRTNISKQIADQMNHDIISSVKLPLDGLKIITPEMIKKDFDEIVNNGYQKSELYISEKTLNRQVKESLSNNGIKSSILDMLIDQASPTIANKFNVEIDTADNRQYLRNLLLARQINQIVMIFSLILIGIVLLFSLWRRTFLSVWGWGSLLAGLIGFILTFWLQKYIANHFFVGSTWQPLMQQLQSFTLAQWHLLVVIELGIGILLVLVNMLKRRWLS